MEKGLVSVVLPIYNVENYLNRCIESVVKQTYKNIEIILVDDGSPDNCPQICEEWAKKDRRIRVIHKKNGGLSDARNAGIEIACGQYITFIDSDDFVDEDFISYLFKLIKDNNADISICEYRYISERGKLYNHPINTEEIRILSQKDGLKELLQMKIYSNSAWGKLYKTEHFNDIRYPYGRLFEDIPTTYKVFMKCNTIAFGARCLYNYMYRTNAISKQGFSPKRLDAVTFAEQMVDDVVEMYPSLKRYGTCRLLDDYVGVLKLVSAEENKQIAESIYGKIKKIRGEVLLFNDASLKRKVYALLSFFGLKMYIRIIKIKKT